MAASHKRKMQASLRDAVDGLSKAIAENSVKPLDSEITTLAVLCRQHGLEDEAKIVESWRLEPVGKN